MAERPSFGSIGFGPRPAGDIPAASWAFGSSSRADAAPAKPATPPPNARRRRRESTPIEEEPDRMDVVKRARREIKGLRGPSASHRASPEAQTDVDMGKQLASLPKESLLSIITSLVGQHPALKPVIQSLIPAPSIDDFASSLAQLEKRVLDSVPRGFNLRDEYVWNRIRGPLDEYVTDNRTYIASFVPPQTNAASSTPGEVAHPTTVFNFLSALTASCSRIEAVLPRSPTASLSEYRVGAGDPLSAHLLPALFNAWHTFATRLAYSVNSQGRILSAETIRGWFRTLEELSGQTSAGFAGAGVARRACENVRERLVKELGWTIGLRTRSRSSSSLRDDATMAFEDDEEL